jgi:hypothetical protein
VVRKDVPSGVKGLSGWCKGDLQVRKGRTEWRERGVLCDAKGM